MSPAATVKVPSDQLWPVPPLKPTTYLLWFGPFLLIAVGSFILLRTLQTKKRTADRDLSEEERQRLQKLLAGAGKDDRA